MSDETRYFVAMRPYADGTPEDEDYTMPLHEATPERMARAVEAEADAPTCGSYHETWGDLMECVECGTLRIEAGLAALAGEGEA